MTYEPLHHKYRPQTFAELVGQEAIAATLTHAIQQQRIAPAYLFTGARGTGKTSSARILAKSLNCLNSKEPTEQPCGQCEVCHAIARGSALDVIEIDAASNTGVDNIRELIERAQFAPVQCRYKVYIIDEVHMLSTAAFNALLKTLEEPPDRVVFVLATTDPQRVLPTIISRCQRFDYRRIPLDAMVSHLRHIATQENIPITDEAITLVAQMAQGGLRDAESLLDQLSLVAGEITVEQVWDLVGSVPERDLLALVQAIVQDHPEPLLESTRRLMDRGREPLIVLQNLASFYRDLLIAKTSPTRNDLVALTPPTWQQLCDLAQKFDLFTILLSQQHLRAAEVQLKHTTQPRLWLEITLMGLLPSAVSPPAVLPAAPTQQAPPPPLALSPPPPIPQAPLPPPVSTPADSTSSSPSPSSSSPAPPVPTPTPQLPSPIPAASNLEQIWQDVIQQMTPYSTQVMVRQQCQLRGFDGQQARISVSTQPLFKIAQSKLPSIEAAFEMVFQRKIHIALEVATGTETALPKMPSTEQSPSDSSPPPAHFSPAAPPSHSSPAVPAAPAAPPASSTPPTSPPSPLDTPDPADRPAEQAWVPEDEATRAAKSLADFFAGVVVNLTDEDDDAATDTPETQPPPAASAKPVTPDTDPWPAAGSDAAIAPASDTDDDDEDLPF
jgi:DNA polymerase-3 subunit gamma/tau